MRGSVANFPPEFWTLGQDWWTVLLFLLCLSSATQRQTFLMILGLMGYKRSHLLNLTQNTDPCVWQSGYQGVGIRDSLMYILSGFIDWPEVLSHPEFSIGFLHGQSEGITGWLWNGLIKHWSVKFCNRFNVQKRPPDRVHTIFYWASFPLMNSGSISYSLSHLSLCPDVEIYSREVGPQPFTLSSYALCLSKGTPVSILSFIRWAVHPVF